MRVVVRAIIRYQDKILALKRSEQVPSPGVWEIPGGSLEDGESLEEGIKREVKEETGLRIDTVTYLSSQAYVVDGEHRLGVKFGAEVSTDKVKLSAESQDYAWVDSSNYNNIGFKGYYKEMFAELFSEINHSSKPQIEVDKKTTYNLLNIHTDGGSRGNPGPSASGYVIEDENGNVIDEGGEYLGITTNNQAEYQAVKLALQRATELTKGELNFYIDSLLVVNQLNGIYKIKNRDLWPIYADIKKLIKQFSSVSFVHIPREENASADSKVNQVLDAQAGN